MFCIVSDPFNNEQYFVGASDIGEEGVWTWSRKQSSSYMVFKGKQPNNIDESYKGEEADCGALRTTYQALIDEYCIQTKPYVCEGNS